VCLVYRPYEDVIRDLGHRLAQTNIRLTGIAHDVQVLERAAERLEANVLALQRAVLELRDRVDRAGRWWGPGGGGEDGI